jgi:hypothetical protein
LSAADGLAIMNYRSRVASVIVVAFLATTAPCARSAGPGGGGGHGGSGGHGSGGHGSGSGGHGGHSTGKSSAGNSSGHSVVHSMGRPFAKMFGHHGKPSPSAQPPITPPEHGNLLNSQNAGLILLPAPRLPHPRPSPRFASPPRFGFFPHHRRFGFGGCPAFAVPGNSFFLGNSFNCFDDGFFLDPFLFGFYGPWFGAPLWFGGDVNHDHPDLTPPLLEPPPRN